MIFLRGPSGLRGVFVHQNLPSHSARDNPGRLSVVILNADDFGRCSEVNQAVAEAYREGMLTSASLMVTGEAVEEAVDLARKMPGLAVGLHVVLVDGRPALPPEKVSHLVGENGRFLRDPLRAGLRYARLGREGREELRRELIGQFERFAATGLKLSHVDGHCHLHVHPVVFDALVPLAEHYGARAIRLPRDSLLPALRHGSWRAWQQAVWAFVFGLLCDWHAYRLRRHRLAVVERSYGFLASGHMREAYLLELLRRLPDHPTEIYLHPTRGRRLDPQGPNPGDLNALLSPAVRSAVSQRWVRLTNHLELT